MRERERVWWNDGFVRRTEGDELFGFGLCRVCMIGYRLGLANTTLLGIYTYIVLTRVTIISRLRASNQRQIFATSDRALTGSKVNSKKEKKGNERGQAEASG